VEKALLFANYLCNELKHNNLNLIVEKARVTLESNHVKYCFRSGKNIVKKMNLKV